MKLKIRININELCSMLRCDDDDGIIEAHFELSLLHVIKIIKEEDICTQIYFEIPWRYGICWNPHRAYQMPPNYALEYLHNIGVSKEKSNYLLAGKGEILLLQNKKNYSQANLLCFCASAKQYKVLDKISGFRVCQKPVKFSAAKTKLLKIEEALNIMSLLTTENNTAFITTPFTKIVRHGKIKACLETIHNEKTVINMQPM